MKLGFCNFQCNKNLRTTDLVFVSIICLALTMSGCSGGEENTSSQDLDAPPLSQIEVIHSSSAVSDISIPEESPKERTVWITASGKKYHKKPDCGNSKEASEISLDEAKKQGFEPCKRCY